MVQMADQSPLAANCESLTYMPAINTHVIAIQAMAFTAGMFHA